nr:phosphoribosylglycinamide formyltransferase [Oceanococcus sp. HetDA_MAG_MS8]
MKRRRLTVLVSGTGRNLDALLKFRSQAKRRWEVVQVISNKPGVAALEIAQRAGIPATVVDHRQYKDRIDFDAALALAIESIPSDAVILAGFMRVLGAEFVQRYAGRMLNIHPSLLPLYRGLKTHQRALEDGQQWHGASIHFVTPELDGGPVIKQGRLRISPTDTPESLAQRVFAEVECKLYPEVVDWLASGRLELRHGRPALDGEALHSPLLSDY